MSPSSGSGGWSRHRIRPAEHPELIGRGLRKRELISRAYNMILRIVLRERFTDAQCGFKAVRGDALAELLPAIRNESWFFDTELLILAGAIGSRAAGARSGRRIPSLLIGDRRRDARGSVHRDRGAGWGDQPPPRAKAVAPLSLGRPGTGVHDEVVERVALIGDLPAAV
jgi:hypothetical protein